MKQWNMMEKFAKYDPDGKIEYVIGDVRDKERLHRIVDGVDAIVHAAATKIVPTAEYNPFECIKTNINGAMNIIDVAIDQKVEKIVALSTDKACNPVNLYGATKLASDKLFIAANLHTLNSDTCFSVVRYGNVMGSRGSVIPFFQNNSNSGVLPITDERMTRFMITLEQGVKLVWHAFDDALGGEIYVHQIPSMKITDVAIAINSEAQQKIIGIRPGEKIHEVMISEEDSMGTYKYKWYYKILPTINKWHLDKNRIKDGQKVEKGFIYSSGNNEDWMTIEKLQKFLKSPEYKELQDLNI
jgi:UDP-N-acetylglucosamine 4,6-dehydratase (inverting)